MQLAQRRKDMLASLMKEGIYEAAVAVMTRLGLDGLTMDRVAEQAGVAKGSLYNYFPSKTELLQFVYDRTIEPVQQSVEKIIDEGRPAVPTLQTCLRAWFAHIEQHRGLFNFLFNDYAVRGFFQDREATARALVMADMTRIIERGIAEGAFRPMDLPRATRMLFGAARETAEHQVAIEGPWPIDELVGGLLDFFLRGVGAVA